MIELDQRTPLREAKHVFLIGPGAAGKSNLGVELAPLLHRRLVDLDQEFLLRVGNIDSFIRNAGYERYKLRNSQLAREIVTEADNALLLVTSSGFLTLDNPKEVLDANHALLATGYSVCLLPSRDFERSVSVIVERQLSRPFSRSRASEEEIIRDRYPIYARSGDLLVFSTAAPSDIAQAVACCLFGAS